MTRTEKERLADRLSQELSTLACACVSAAGGDLTAKSFLRYRTSCDPAGRAIIVGRGEVEHLFADDEDGHRPDFYRVRFRRPDGTEAWLGDDHCGPNEDPTKSPVYSFAYASRSAELHNANGSGYRYWIVPVDSQEPMAECDVCSRMVPCDEIGRCIVK